MKNITNLITKYCKNTLVVFTLLFTIILSAQETEPTDPNESQTGYAIGKIKLKDPSSIISKYTYDPKIDRYIYTETVGNYDIRYPLILTPKQYRELLLKESMKDYFKEKLNAISGKKDGSEDAQKNLLPKFYVNSNFFESIFGGNTIEVIPQGSVAMDLGIRFQKNDNPALSPRNRSNLSFDFDQRISLSLLGKVGERLKINANYDTESTFDFQNQIKLEYTPTEDDILQKIEVGNVSMPLNSSLITGAQSLFGVKTELQFGNTRITGVFSEQRSQTRTITAQGGGTIEEFALFALDYDEDRHFFLSQYFRDRYDTALANYPFVNTPVEITRVEVWVTNRSAQTNNVRNIVGLQDLGEANPDRTKVNQYSPFPGEATFFNSANPDQFPDNENNDYNPELIGTGSVLTDDIRDIATIQQGFGALSGNVQQGFDYVYLENARKLNENEYKVHTKLGYISLNQRLSNDEVLAVAFQYTANGQVFQVGEFANGGIDATQVTNTDTDGNPTQIENQNLVVKLLKSAITEVNDPIWDLMMKNIYSTDAYQLSPDDFRLNILYTDPSPVNYITAVDGGPALPADVADEILLKVFNLDRLDIYQNPQAGGDGFFDYYPGLTVDQEFGRIIFTTVEPFGEFLFEKLRNAASENYDIPANYNANQSRYVYRSMYTETKAGALDDAELNKFQLKGRYKSQGGDGIPLGAFNVPRGSVVVTAGGRVLQEGIDYTVNYQLGRVQILDEALKASNTPIDVSVENNSLFGQQNKRFTGINVEHQFSKDFLIGATYLNLNERPITQKANYGAEPVNNSIFGFNGNYSTEVPFLTRLVNKLPNVDTDVASNVSIRGEFAYLLPGSPKNADFEGEATAYVDDFEGAQSAIDIKSPLGWFLASAPGTPGNTLGDNLGGEFGNDQLQYGFNRAKLAWYTIDPIFYGNQAPGGISDDDVSTNETRRIFVDEIFPQTDIARGQTTIQTTLDLAYYPNERGPYNNNPNFVAQPDQDSWGGIMRPVTTTNFEQANVEYIQFWVLDPFFNEDGTTNTAGSGELVLNIGNISEDILKDGRKQYENGLPEADAVNPLVTQTAWGEVPQTQSLVYAFDSEDANRQVQDVGLDGLADDEEGAKYTNYAAEADPAGDNYQYFLNADGDVLNRYKNYNGTQGNSPIAVTDTNRGSTTVPDVEDINRDQTMNTIDNYYQFRIPLRSGLDTASETYITDVRDVQNLEAPNGGTVNARWIQFKIPISDFHKSPDATVTPDEKIPLNDLRSIRFVRMYMTGFSEPTVLRFATLDLIRGDWRRYNLTLQDNEDDPQDGADANTQFDVNTVNIEENANKDPIGYVVPPGVVREQLNNNNTVIRQNEQSLAMSICNLESGDSRGVFKNIDIDLRQYKNLKMFVHAESLAGQTQQLGDQQAVAFLRFGNDFTQNYYQVEIPLNVTLNDESSAEDVWKNEFDIPLALLTRIKAANFNNATGATEVAYYNENADPIVNQFADYASDERMRIAIIGNPTIGRVRSLMVGIKNATADGLDATDTPIGGIPLCGEFWFNELRLAELENRGGWAAVGSLDANLADFATVSASGRISTVGFGNIEQSPNERSREDVKQYDVVTNISLGQLLPKKWGIKIPFNYSIGEEIITPEFDPFYQDIRLEDRLDLAATEAEKDRITEEAIDYTKRKSINFIGVRKERGAEQKARFYDVENITLSYSYNETEHHDYEIKSLRDQNVRAGLDYNFNFQPKSIEPFKKNDSLFTGRYWKWLKDFNFNPLPTSISLNSNITRSFNDQIYRDPLLPDAQAENLPRLQQRNFLFDWSYAINYNLTNSLRFNFTAANNNIVNNYFDENGDIDVDFGIWDGFWDIGDPNTHTQSLQLTYDLPLNKIPTFSFLDATYSYTGDFNWQRGSDVLQEVAGERLNTIQNANTHNINASLDMTKFYKYLGFVRKRKGNRKTNLRSSSKRPGVPTDGTADKGKKKTSNKASVGTKIFNTVVDIFGSVKRINVSYSENNGKVLPGYTPSIGFIGTLKPSVGFVFGSQADVRYEAARRGYLTEFTEFNQQFTQVHNKNLDITAMVEPLRDLKIDVVANRNYSENFSEQFNVQNGEYISLSPNGAGNTFGNFGISTLLIKTAFKQSDENQSVTFEDFEENRQIIARRLAIANGQPLTDTDGDGFPDGYGKTNQAVLLPAFLAAYTGKDANDIKLGAFRDVPIPNWTVKYTGLMRLKWFKKRFKRFSLSHGYRSSYTINSFRNNLDFDAANPFAESNKDQGGNFHNQNIFSNINLVEQFNPLIRIDFEMKNSIKVLAEVKRDRALSLSFDNNLLTEVSGNEYIVGLGYRFKDVRIDTRIAGKKTTLKGDLNLKADLSLRDNITIIRSLDLFNNQVTAGQTLWSLKFTADYALSRNLTALFYYDHTFSEFAVSTAFPQTTIRSGITLRYNFGN
ncbi:cell surface protein SprA [Kordia sp.]|uniref:T9SS outer membrane translocon Sov/SprA n=1 Tax=Kordia sp. TaxID=1965332 RepID=UPI003B5A9926